MTGAAPPGGTGALFGMKVVRYAGARGVGMLIASIAQLAAVLIVATNLGTEGAGRYAVLLFLMGLLQLVFNMASRTGTIRRTFGTDDEDDDDEDEEGMAGSPQRSLAVGLMTTATVAAIGIGLVSFMREPLAEALLGAGSPGRLVVWAAVAAAFGAVYSLASMIIWLERRPAETIAVEVLRALALLIAMFVLLSGDGGLDGAILAMAIANGIAALACVVLLRRSVAPAFDLHEVEMIYRKGAFRVPIIISFWIVGNVDVFLLSRFLDFSEVGIYQLASRTGFVVALFPQGFRIGMRPLRKTAGFKALRQEYGKAIANGQVLTYLLLTCVFALLVMTMLGQVVVGLAPEEFSPAGPLVPAVAAGLLSLHVMRAVKQNASLPNGRVTLVWSSIFAATWFVPVSIVLIPLVGLYGPPIAAASGFALPTAYMLLRSQLGPAPIEVEWLALVRGALLAAACAALFVLIDPGALALQLVLTAALSVLFLVLAFVLRVIPRYHRAPLAQAMRSAVTRGHPGFDPVPGIAALSDQQRHELRQALASKNQFGEPIGAAGKGQRRRATRHLRRAAIAGGIDVAPKSHRDPHIAHYVFGDEPQAVRDATMRDLLSGGIGSHDLQALLDVAQALERLPDEAWADGGGDGEPRRRRWLRRA